jgi:hypothetical protein
MTSFFGAYLGREVQLSGEREAYIAARHPDPRPEHRERIGAALADPDQVRRRPRFGAAKLFSRWFLDVRGGKHVVVVVVSPGRGQPPLDHYGLHCPEACQREVDGREAKLQGRSQRRHSAYRQTLA